MMQIMTSEIVSSLKAPFTLTSAVTNAMLRFIHGDALADALGTPKTELTAMMPVLAFANKSARQLQRSIPSVWKQLADKSIETYTKLITDHSKTAEYRDRLKPAGAAPAS